MGFYLKKHFSRLLLGLFFALLIAFLAINYFVSVKVHKLFFAKIEHKEGVFNSSYSEIELSYQGKSFKVHKNLNPALKEYILYVPGTSGPLSFVLDEAPQKYNVFAIEYPQQAEFQNFSDFKKMIQASVEYIKSLGIAEKDLILLGQGVGANVVLNFSKDRPFEAIMLFNPLEPEKNYCKQKFSSVFCLLAKSSLSFQGLNQNLVYYFFNENNIASPEQNYEIFNLIDAKEKFLFEIPGNNLNFNFNHIVEFYNNESVIQNENFDYLEADPEDKDPSVIDVDGLLNPDDYFDF